jgi:hypothetical protein
MPGSKDVQKRPSAFVSYAQTSKTWQQEVLRFTTALRTLGGIDAELDLFHAADHQQWSTFGSKLVATSDFTLIAVDKAYRRRWLGQEEKGVGAGVAREAAAVKALFEEDQEEFVRRVKIIILPSADLSDVPEELRSICERFQIPKFDEAGLEELLRSLWGRPAFPKPPLGKIPTLPPKAVESLERDSLTEVPSRGTRAAGELPPSRGDSDSDDEASLKLQLNRVKESLANPDDESDTEELKRELAAIENSLEALSEARTDVGEEHQDEAGERPGIPESLRPLIEALGDVDEMVRFNAMAALGDRLSPELLPVIEPLLKDSDSHIRQMAVDYYAQLAGPDATPRLVEALNDADEMVRFNAMAALGDRLSPELLRGIEPLM